MLLWKDAAVRIPTATYRLQLHKDFGFSYSQVLAQSMRQLRRKWGLQNPDLIRSRYAEESAVQRRKP